MTRIRSLKPELLEDAKTAGLSDAGLRLFVSAILLADDQGRLRLEPAWLRGQVWWARPDVTDAHVRSALRELTGGEAPLIVAYEVSGQVYGQVRTWGRHQKVDHPAKPRLPAPPDTLLANVSRESREDLAPDLRSGTSDQGPPIRDQGPVGAPSETLARPVRENEIELDSWQAWPLRAGGTWALPSRLLDRLRSALPGLDPQPDVVGLHAWYVARPRAWVAAGSDLEEWIYKRVAQQGMLAGKTRSAPRARKAAETEIVMPPRQAYLDRGIDPDTGKDLPGWRNGIKLAPKEATT